MAEFNQVLWVLDNAVEARAFEHLCCDLLCREGFRHIVPIGGMNDLGRDAEVKYWRSASGSSSLTIFQFSLEDRWEKKLNRDAEKIRRHTPEAKSLIFVTSQQVTGAKREKLATEFKARFDFDLSIYDRHWIRIRLEESHCDLAQKYLGLELPNTICHSAHLIELSDYDGDLPPETFFGTSPDLVRASIIESTRKEPEVAGLWRQLAKIECHFLNWDKALFAAAMGIQKSDDPVEKLNLELLRAAILAEKGIQNKSRPLLIEARDIFIRTEMKLGRAVDCYNLANVFGALSEIEEAEIFYRRCLELDQNYGRAWKNLGSLILPLGRVQEAIECFDKALESNPSIVEAVLSKANALLLFQMDAPGAVLLFKQAYKMQPDLDRKWKYVRYWYSQALLVAGDAKQALVEADLGLLLHAGDIQYLNQKAATLSELWKSDKTFEPIAFNFFKYRAQAIPDDFYGLNELIQLCARRKRPEEGWDFVVLNLACDPVSFREIASAAGISLADFQIGLRYCALYSKFRRNSLPSDHLAYLRNCGLSPNPEILVVLNYLLMVPFGILAETLTPLSVNLAEEDIRIAFERNLQSISRLFVYFGTQWICADKPNERDHLINVVSLGVACLPDIIVAEAGRHFGFLVGHFDFPEETARHEKMQNLSAICAEAGAEFFERVAVDWHLGAEK